MPINCIGVKGTINTNKIVENIIAMKTNWKLKTQFTNFASRFRNLYLKGRQRIKNLQIQYVLHSLSWHLSHNFVSGLNVL